MNISELQLLTGDLDQTSHFYHEILGLEILSYDNAVMSFSAGLSVLTFHQSDDKNPVYHFAFNIPNNKFSEAMNWASSKLDMIEITASNYAADFKSWNAKAFYFHDNNQNIVEMIARFDLDNPSHQPFGGDSVCSISEIGVVVENPKDYAALLLADDHLHFYSKQAPADDFITIGNDEGLLIIVRENRNWYPTHTRSSKHWVKITIQLPGRLAEMVLNE